MVKKVIIFLFLIIFIIVAVFAWGRYGWKLWGFSACTSPHQIYVSDIQINNNDIVIKGQTASSADSFVGYVYRISDNKLYIGLKYNLLFGFIDRDGSFNIKVPCDTESIKEIYLTNDENKELIWPNNPDNNENQ